MSVCLVVCPSVVPNYFLNPWSDWDKKFCTKIRENEYVKILILDLRDHCPRVKPLV
jgi:hypothetical protein